MYLTDGASSAGRSVSNNHLTRKYNNTFLTNFRRRLGQSGASAWWTVLDFIIALSLS